MGLSKAHALGWTRRFETGSRNLITDVPGVTVGQVTLAEGEINTGVTAILPHRGDLFRDKVAAGLDVINGFGKSIGLVQLKELGVIETPIILTNTMSVGTAYTALTRYMLERGPEIGVTTSTVNSLVLECNDGRLNDIRGMHVKEEHVLEAIRNAGEEFEEGAVGAGRGMVCLGFKGGIGSSSRVLEADGGTYTIGALILSNFGSSGRLTVQGRKLGEELLDRVREARKKREELQEGEKKPDYMTPPSEAEDTKDKGSIVIIIATDLPLSDRQLSRVSRRSAAALARTGSFYGNGSGDIAVTFSTSNIIPHFSDRKILVTKMFHDEEMDPVFECAAEAVEEAVISSLWHADTVTGVRGNTWFGIREFL